MTSSGMSEAVLFGALTGMRSMSGAAALAHRRRGTWQRATAVMAIGEMLADKTPFVGNRTDPLPLVGRAVMGAVVGGTIAHDERANVLIGGVLGATAAVIAAHLAYQVRRRVQLPGAVAGLLEDALVFGVGAMFARRAA